MRGNRRFASGSVPGPGCSPHTTVTSVPGVAYPRSISDRANELLRLADRELLVVIGTDRREQAGSVGALDRGVEHVVRDVRDRRGLGPGRLLLAPAGVLGLDYLRVPRLGVHLPEESRPVHLR